MARPKSPYSRLSFLTAEDRAILGREFKVEDPRTLTGLLTEPPVTRVPPEIEFTYDVRPKGGKSSGESPSIKCVFPHGARHWEGYVIHWRKFGRALLGPDCGAGHFGFTYNEAKDAFDAKVNRQSDLIKFVLLRERLPAVMVELRLVPQYPCIRTYDESLVAFRAGFPKLAASLSRFAKEGGLLQTTEEERNWEAENERDKDEPEAKRFRANIAARQNDRPNVLKAEQNRFKAWREKRTPIMKVVHTDVGALAGFDFIKTTHSLSSVASSAVMKLSLAATEIERNTSGRWSKAYPFSRTFKQIYSAMEEIERLEQALVALRSFGSAGNLKRISDWTVLEARSVRPRLDHPVRVDGDTLVCTGTRARWAAPRIPTLDLPPHYVALSKALRT